jgi:tripartite-type tricarboxylate transporter receptor subunit TctC
MAEQGLAGFAVEQWHGLLAPAATPEPVIARLHQVLTQILAEPEMQQALREQGYTPAGESAAQFGKLIAADIERYAAVTAQLGLTVD